MAKGQMRSNREKKKPKQDKNKKKGAEASSPLAGMHGQVKLGTSYMSQYGKKQPHTVKRPPPYHSDRALTLVRMSFVSRRIPYRRTVLEPVLELSTRDLAYRTFGICCLYESGPA